MAADAPRLAILVQAGEFERVHYALVLAAAALAVGRPVTLFFTLAATRALLPAVDGGPPGWAALPAAGGRRGEEIDEEYRRRGVADFEQLLAACRELGARILVCEMALRALNLTEGDLRRDLPWEVAGVVTLLGDVGAAPVVL